MEYTIIEGNYASIGVSKAADVVYFTFEGEKEQKCAIWLYTAGGKKTRIPVPDEYCIGALRSIGIKGLNWKRCNYNYEIDGKVTLDPHAHKVIGREKWADPGRLLEAGRIRSGFDFTEFDWKNDRFPEIPREKMVMYKLNVRSFTMDAGAVGKRKGTFAGIIDKIPYLKELGVTTLELMPVYEFEEVMPLDENGLDIAGWSQNAKEGLLVDQAYHHKIDNGQLNISEKPDKRNKSNKDNGADKEVKEKLEKEKRFKVNCWGYIPGDYYAPKASYCSEGEPSVELKTLIYELHKNHMECVLEMYFDEKMNQNIVIEILRYWVIHYHVDGFHLVGARLPANAMAQDLILRRTKLFASGFDAHLFGKKTSYPHLFIYNDDFLYASRKMLSRIDCNIVELLNQLRRQNPVFGFVNYLANNNGFTLADLFCYGQKHNEANGEGNRDGIEWNYSCNCGAEGATRKKNILEYRKKLVRNAVVIVMLGQGVPLLMAGDEFGNSQEGNNNCYCQDNHTGWVNWKDLKRRKSLTEFVQDMIGFRKAHPVLSSGRPMQLADYASKGCPDLSYHGENAWTMAPNMYQQAIGILYCGAYALREDGTEDDYIFVGMNFYIGTQFLALPKLPGKKKWYMAVNTADKEKPFYKEYDKIEIGRETQIAVLPQSIVILVGK